MREFFLFTVIYSGVAIVFATVAGMHPGLAAQITTLRLMTAVRMVLPVAILAAPLIAGLWWFGKRGLLVQVRDAALALGATAVLMASFMTLKAAMPGVLPYFADPLLADLDAALHLGTDPWSLTHAVAGSLPAETVDLIYVKAWSLIVLGLPIALALDPDAARQRVFLTLYLSAWVICGNVMALAGLSGGPVYYAGLTGVDRFADLHGALASSGIADSFVGSIQASLWSAYEKGDYALAAGISAFPSVHVAVACVSALYLQARLRTAASVGWAFLGAILFLSVHTGYHYAIDGYASIIVICTILAVLRRRATIGEGQSAPA
ncbi:hypothetical protein PARPLA_00645 [Rhodobacteraceae bacterium THAF1]|uniref:phosphatase PAP2 family protein n=1 Tax=Palleronia sp. THAF1 TaxID=2587842 RepID=UPI000F3EDCFA|nr:phosphatase PAP2 family protein [Palleronia sp. THAF1]QFU09792.1 hypothetical protein FIU81_14035 [Palleronia sp. THAF1]VDC17305.1 hypothetical protein PARPLA_00645 [Rhodobacteraceae bacterium THAF1]